MFNQTFRSPIRIGGCSYLRIVATLWMAASLILGGVGVIHAEPNAVVGTGTPASCTEAALTAALVSGGTVTFNCGGPATILVLKQQTISQPTTIDGGGVITITAGLASKLFLSLPSAKFDLRNITLDSAFSEDADGAAIRALGPLALNNVTIQNSIASSVSPQAQTRYCGGAVFIAASATIRNSAFIKNTALIGGGAICVRSSELDSVVVRDSVFTNNQSINPNGRNENGEGLGGAILADMTTKLSIIDSAFNGNVGRLGGAAYAAPSATLELRGTPTTTIFSGKLRFDNNQALEAGGALYNTGVLSMSYALLNQNRVPTQSIALHNGGGIYSEGVFTMTDSWLVRNEGDYGGGVYVGGKETAQATVERSMFNRNNSDDQGGGLYAELRSSVTISSSAFHRNISRRNGGGVADIDAQLNLYNSSFTGNTANAGGGLYVSHLQPTNTSVTIRSSTFSGNTSNSDKGGGFYNRGARVAMQNATLINNGSGLYNTDDGDSGNGGDIHMSNSVFSNTALLNCTNVGTAKITDDGNNLSTDASCPLLSNSTNAANPALGPLTLDTIGITSYHMPLSGSPLIDKGANCPTLDQIDATRVGVCDIGAVEFGGTSTHATPTPSPTASPTPSTTPSPTAPTTPTSTSTPSPTPPTTNKYTVFVPMVAR